MQMMQMQGFMQMQQQMGAPPMGQPSPAAMPTATPTPEVLTKLVLITVPYKDGKLVRAEGQRTTVPIVVDLDDRKQPTGTYSTALSLRMKAAAAFPEVPSDRGWQLYVGELTDDQPSNVSFVAGKIVADSDSSWRELFKCAVLSKAEPVIFVHPCLDGHEGRDVDRKRAASMMLETDKAEAEAAAQMLSNASPAKHGKGSVGASVRSSKAHHTLHTDSHHTPHTTHHTPHTTHHTTLHMPHTTHHTPHTTHHTPHTTLYTPHTRQSCNWEATRKLHASVRS